jgi:hypothetical protein
MSKQGTSNKRKHETLIIFYNPEISGRLERGKSQREIIAVYHIGSSTIYDIKKQKDHSLLYMTSSESVKDFSSSRY